MILQTGDKVLIAHRRLFPEDRPRFFVGVVECYEHGLARVEGHSWSIDVRSTMVRKVDPRTKVIAIASGTLIVYQLPGTVDLEKVEVHSDRSGETILTAGPEFRMDLTERV